MSGSPPPFSSHISKISPHSPLIRGDKCIWHRFPEIYESWEIYSFITAMPTALPESCLQLLIRITMSIKYYREGFLNYSPTSLADREIENTTEKWPKTAKNRNMLFYENTLERISVIRPVVDFFDCRS